MKEPRLSGVARLRRALFSLKTLLRDPAGWSAEHYRRKNRMDYVALRPERWGTGPDRDRGGGDEAGGAEGSSGEEQG